MNRYSYALNNPLGFIDPTGNEACDQQRDPQCPKTQQNQNPPEPAQESPTGGFDPLALTPAAGDETARSGGTASSERDQPQSQGSGVTSSTTVTKKRVAALVLTLPDGRTLVLRPAGTLTTVRTTHSESQHSQQPATREWSSFVPDAPGTSIAAPRAKLPSFNAFEYLTASADNPASALHPRNAPFAYNVTNTYFNTFIAPFGALPFGRVAPGYSGVTTVRFHKVAPKYKIQIWEVK